MKYEEVGVDDIAQLLKVTKKSAVQRLSRLVQRHHAVKLNFPCPGSPSRFQLLVPMDSLLKTQKFLGPKMSREVDWTKFCADPFNLAKEKVAE